MHPPKQFDSDRNFRESIKKHSQKVEVFLKSKYIDVKMKPSKIIA